MVQKTFFLLGGNAYNNVLPYFFGMKRFLELGCGGVHHSPPGERYCVDYDSSLGCERLSVIDFNDV